MEVEKILSIAELEALRDDLHRRLKVRCQAAQLFEHRRCSLSLPTTLHRSSHGQSDTMILVDTVQVHIEPGRVNMLTVAADGTVVQDTEQDRIRARAQMAQLAAKHCSDAVVTSLFKSYEAAVQDPAKELVHLYEIRDALSARFGGEGGARQELGLTRAQWSELGRLANDEPIIQGRHGGKHFDSLRNATQAELDLARSLAKAMVEAYLGYLDKL
jgi:hypothetical protein